MRPDYVDLGRQFASSAHFGDIEDAAVRNYAVGLREDGEGWASILKVQYVVVLAEAGAGKTWELEAEAYRQRASGQLAFFTRLDVLAQQSFAEACLVGTSEELENWKRGSGRAIFFLDSVDEARLASSAHFIAALQSLARVLGARLNDAQVVISCRVTEWRGQRDQFEVARVFGVPTSTKKVESAFDVVEAKNETDAIERKVEIFELLPLKTSQIKRLAEFNGEMEAQRFASELETQDALSFAGRPRDVMNLLAYWREHGRMGSLCEIIEFDIDSKLRETNSRGRSDSLSVQRARQGAQTLAAAAIFGRSLVFKIPENDDSSITGNVIDTLAAVPENFSRAEVDALLQRPIFDEATFGRIRFHHRTIVEYLAARWVEDRMTNGCTFRALEQLIIQKVHGTETISESRASVAAWLVAGESTWNKRLLLRVLATRPEILLKYGDPSSLSVEVRRQVFSHLIQKYSSNVAFRDEIEDAQLIRVASHDLADDLNRYLSATETSADLQYLLLRLVWRGRISGVSPSLFKILTDPAVDLQIKRYAIRAIGASGTAAELAELWRISARWFSMPSYTAGLLAKILYPCTIQNAGLQHLIVHSRRIPPNTVAELPYQLQSHLESFVQDDDLDDLVARFLALIQRRPFMVLRGELLQLSKLYAWLGIPLISLTRKMLLRADLEPSSVQLIASVLIVQSDIKKLRHSGREEKPLQEGSLRHPIVRRAYSRARLALSSRTDPHHLAYDMFSGYDAPLHLVLQDFSWIIEEFEQAANEKVAAVYAWLAVRLVREVGLDAASVLKLQMLSRRWSSITQIVKTHTPSRIRAWLNRIRQHLLYERQYRFEDRLRRFHQRTQDIRTLFWLWRNANRIAAGGLKAHLADLLRHTPDRSNSFEPGAIKSLAGEFGFRIAKAVADGCRSIWASYRPGIGRERLRRDDDRLIIGLAGIRQEIESGRGLQDFSKNEAETAAACSVREINGLPDWAGALARWHPREFEWVVYRTLLMEWGVQPGENSRYRLLEYALRSDSNIEQIVAAHAAALLLGGDPADSERLADALELVIVNQKSRASFWSGVARTRTLQYARGSSESAIWLSAWLRLDPDAALDWLEGESMRNSAATTRDVVKLCAVLYERQEYTKSADPLLVVYQSVSHMRRLTRLTCEHVNIVSDINHDDGQLYSPGSRDRAQDLRGRLLSNLIGMPDASVYRVLTDLRDDPKLIAYRERFDIAAQARLIADAESPAWRARDIAAFAEKFEIVPRSSNDLFRMCMNRLEDIKGSVEGDDFSFRIDMRRTDPESRLQNWLAAKLLEGARGSYAVVREPEVDRQNMPDIRLVSPNVGPVTLELKWAHDWSAKALDAVLPDQLVGKYMKDRKSKHGILVLASAYPTRRWKTGGSDLMDFKQLVERISAQAKEVLASRSDLENVAVVSIDFGGT
jgi:hypothetical protein